MPLVEFKDLMASAQSPNRQKSCARSRQDEYLAPTLASLRAQEVWKIAWFEHVCTTCRNALSSGNAGDFFEFPMQAHLASLDLLKPSLQAFESCKKFYHVCNICWHMLMMFDVFWIYFSNVSWNFFVHFHSFCRCLHPSYLSLSCLMQSVLQRLMFSRTNEVNDDLMNTYGNICEHSNEVLQTPLTRSKI